MKKVLLMTCLLALSIPSLAAARQATSTPDPAKVKQDVEKALQTKVETDKAVKTKIEDAQFNPRWVRTLTNVQIELTLTDQTGAGAPDKKTVSMIASSGNWGKIRSSGSVIRVGEPPYGVELNVDARPYVSVDGAIQVEMTLNYAPVRGPGDTREGPAQRPSGINQSQTVVLQSGKSLTVSQAADPLSDRKVTVELKATVLK